MENNKPLFSFVVPVYNVEKYLNQCVDSILNQEYKNLEIILVDDGSPDNSGKICDEYAKKDERVRVFHKENGGVSSARNYGIQKATGRYLLFVDSDDFIAMNALSDIASKISDNEYDFIFLKGYKYFSNDKIQEIDIDINLDGLKTKDEIMEYISKLSKFPGSACTKIFSKRIIDKHGIFFEKEIVSFEDIEFVIKLLKFSNKFTAINIPYYFYRQNRKCSATNSIKATNINSMIKVIKRHAKKEIKHDNLNYINSFLAYEYIILLAYYISLSKKERKKVEANVYEYKWLLKFNNNSKVKLTYILKNIIGIKMTSRLLYTYMKLR